MASEGQLKMEAGLTKFAVRLYNAAIKSNDGDNVFISPHSVTSALMLTCLGAKGDTKQQILNCLGFPEDDAQTAHAAFKQVNESLTKLGDENSDMVLTSANKIFAKEGLSIRDQYIKDSADFYNSGVDVLQFADDPDGSRKTINEWVQKQTNDKIKELLQQGTISSLTSIVLVNAIYFKGLWAKPFEASKTTKKEFNVSAAETATVDMMSGKFELVYVENDNLGYSAVAIPYKNRDVAMVILLPKQIDGLNQLETEMDSEQLTKLFQDLRTGIKSNVSLGVPKFVMSKMSDMTAILSELGIKDLFNRAKADLGGLTEGKDISIDQVVHQAVIEVNEEGTEAAAATAMISRMMVRPMGEHTFICDRPFQFILANLQSSTILFYGRFIKP